MPGWLSFSITVWYIHFLSILILVSQVTGYNELCITILMKSLYLYVTYCKKCGQEFATISVCWIFIWAVVSPLCLKTVSTLPYEFLLHITDFLKLTLENYVKNLEVPVKIIRMEERSGLIRARLRGAAASRGQVITFLDAHCECTAGWLEPLLARIKEDR